MGNRILKALEKKGDEKTKIDEYMHANVEQKDLSNLAGKTTVCAGIGSDLK